MFFFQVKTEKKTVQFSDDVQVETIEPEPEPAFIDEVSDFLVNSDELFVQKLDYLFSCSENVNSVDKVYNVVTTFSVLFLPS